MNNRTFFIWIQAVLVIKKDLKRDIEDIDKYNVETYRQTIIDTNKQIQTDRQEQLDRQIDRTVYTVPRHEVSEIDRQQGRM